nr:PREDICTED: adhesion G protein-coupled receptor E1-like isoform X2 [Lepisosteus oculatus]
MLTVWISAIVGRFFLVDCSCPSGFTDLSNGTCTDIDECASGICPYNSLCFNTIGSYYCQCKPGFRPTSSLDIFTESSQTCGDVDECSLIGYCPKNSVCFNINGSYYCQCKTGFRSTSRTTNFTSVSEKCTDVNECRENVIICGVNTICSNTIGNYFCTCKPGYKSSSGEENFNTTNNVLCEDVNECEEDQGICGSNATCRNTDGSYRCDCHLGFSNRGNSTGHCSGFQKVTDCTALLKEVPASSIEKCLSDLFSSKNITSYEPKKIVGAISSFLNQSVLQTNLTVHARSIAGEMCLNAIESIHLPVPKDSYKLIKNNESSHNLDLQWFVIPANSTHKIESLQVNGNTLQVNLQNIMQNASNGIGTVLFASYTGLEFLLDGRYFQNKSSEDIVSPQINSNIVTVVINQKKNHIHTLLQPINVTFQNKQIEEDSALSVIEYVFVITSLICLGLAIITFVFCKSVQKGHNTIHLHLSLCLFMAHLLLLTGGSKTENKMICAVIAGVLHFLFLASFVWMCLEGVQLLLLVTNLRVVKYSSRNRLTKRYLFPPGYGIPAVIVAVSAGVCPGGYGTQKSCWLSFERAFAWSFLGPVSFFISVNIIMFAIILWALKSQLSFINTDVSKVRNTRLLTFKAMAHCFIMGCSWILGFFQGVKFFSYMFVIVNSLQGPFIFLVHCVLNQQIRAEYRRWLRCTYKKKYKSESSGVTMRTLADTNTTDPRSK